MKRRRNRRAERERRRTREPDPMRQLAAFYVHTLRCTLHPRQCATCSAVLGSPHG